MRVGVVVQGQEGVTWPRWLALAEAAEAAGLESLFSSDHYRKLIYSDDGARDTWTVLTALAARTTRIRLGSLVSPVTFRHPSLLARIVVTAAEVAGTDRVELGLGAGWHEHEHRQHGFPFPPLPVRLEQLAEQAEIITRSWAGDPFDFTGNHYRLEAAQPRPVPATRPSLLIGGDAKRGTVSPAVAFADEYNTPFAGVEACRERRRAVDEACEAAGRRDPLVFSVMMNCVTAEREPELTQRLERWLEVVGRPVDPTRTIVGTTGQVVEKLAAYEAAGVDRILLQDLSLNLEMLPDYGAVARIAGSLNR